MGDTKLSQINELKEERTNKNHGQRSRKRGGWRFGWKVSRRKQVPAAT